MSDIRYALRLLARSRLFTATVAATIAIGIGAATTIFSVVNAVLLRPLPFRDSDRLLQVAEKNDKLHLPTFTASALNYLSWRAATQTFEQLGAIGFQTFTLSGSGDPETYSGGLLTSSVLPVLGINPVMGRGFTPDDERPGAAHVALISESLWRRRFGSDPNIVGRPVTLNGAACSIVGIAPRALTLLANGDVWTPLVIDPPKEIRLNHVLVVVGRLRPGVTVRAAQTEMDAISARVGAEYPEVRDWGIVLVTLTDTLVSRQLRTALLVLLAAVGFLLLIVSANVANLLLARAIDRRREMAVRAALGAQPGRLLRQVLVESVILSSIGGAAGVLLAVWGVDALQSGLPPNTLPVLRISVDRFAVSFSVAVTLLTGAAFGLMPAWQASRTDMNVVLKEGGRSGTGNVRATLRRLLAGAELALATVLLVGAALMTRTLIALEHVPLGFDPAGLLSFQISLPQTRYDPPRRLAFFRDFEAAVAALPGVQQVGLSSGIPFGAGTFSQSPFTAPGSSVLPRGASVPINWRTVSPGYFDAVKMPLLRGRRFTASDTTSAPQVMIVSRETARMFWGDDEPVGKIVRRVADSKDFTVVGVIGDVRSITLDQLAPSLYFPTGSRAWPLMDVVVRPEGDATPVMAAIRQRVRGMDPDLALSNVRPMAEWVAASAAQQRLNAVLLAAFAVVALAIAAVGIYGVLAYSVSQRTRELGVRMALGAARGSVVRLIVFEGLTVGIAGIAFGFAGAAASGRVLSALIYGVSPFDLSTYAAVGLALAAIAVVSCAVPAVRAARVDPIIALRLE